MANKKNTAKNKGKVSNGMGSIRKRSNGSYEVRYTEVFDLSGKQIQRSKSFKTEREANEFRVKTLNQINEGTYVSPNKMPFKEWATFYLNYHTSSLKELTKKSYEDRLRLHIIPALGNIKLCKLTHPAVQVFIDSLGRKTETHKALAPKTIYCIHGVLHTVLDKAVGLGYLAKNPADGITLPKLKQIEIKTLNDSQTVELLKAIKDDTYNQVYLIALFMGLRQGEVLGLTWDCINWEKNVVTIRQQLLKKRDCKIIENTDNDDENLYKIAPVKNDKIRYLCVDDEIMEIFRSRLEEQKEQRKRAGDLWYEPFPNLIFENAFGKHFTHCTARKHFKKSVAKIGLPEERFHNLRHNYTARALESGDAVSVVQKNLGHSTENFTLRVYAHETEEAKIKSAKNMNDRIKMLKELMA